MCSSGVWLKNCNLNQVNQTYIGEERAISWPEALIGQMHSNNKQSASVLTIKNFKSTESMRSLGQGN